MRDDSSESRSAHSQADPMQAYASRFGLRFNDAAFEVDYRAAHAQQSGLAQRIGLLMALVIYAAFAVLDYWMVPSFLHKTLAIRAVVVATCMLLLLHALRQGSIQQRTMAGSVFMLGAGILALLAVIDVGAIDHYYVGLILVVVGSHAMFGLLFGTAALVSALLIVGYGLLELLRGHTSEMAFGNLMFVLSAWLIAAYGGYVSERRNRQAFLRAVLIGDERKRAQQAATQSELNALRAQVNPHFLFNSLSTLYDLIAADREQAKALLLRLAEVFRYAARHATTDLVRLSEELEFLQALVDVLVSRHGSGLVISIERRADDSSAWLPPMSLQTLVENALKHNAFSVSRPLHVEVLRSETPPGMIVRHARVPRVTAPAADSGTGLPGLQNRYRLLGAGQIEILDTVATFSVRIPLILEGFRSPPGDQRRAPAPGTRAELPRRAPGPSRPHQGTLHQRRQPGLRSALRLRFGKPALESAYQHAWAQQSLLTQRVGLLVAVLLYGAFGALDLSAARDVVHLTLPIRSLLVVATLMVLAHSMRVGTMRQGVMAGSLIMLSAGFIAILAVIGSAALDRLYVGLILLVVGVHGLSGLLFPRALAVSTSIVGGYLALEIAKDHRAELAFNNLMFLVSACLVAAYGGFVSEQRSRVSYLRAAIIEKERQRVQQHATRSELNALRAQVNPHFLFNSLSTLYDLIDEDREQAKKLLLRLADVFRYAARHATTDLVRLSEELEFLQAFVDVLMGRHGRALVVTIERRADDDAAWLPPMSLQTLVENALKHNAFSALRPLHVRVLRSDQPPGVIVRHAREPRVTASATGSGTGLAGLRKRYHLLGAGQIDILEASDMFTVRIPLVEAR